jgi:alanyl-tRNA synthetase
VWVYVSVSAGKDGGIAAGDALRACVAAVGGKGGGSPAFAQGVITAQGDQFAAACGWAEQFVEPES